ncbi:hypothetical protein KTR9_3657 [Gordonia sp. KTR9]|nr:hypothetical protein KTR9_3657 [Gordonia sp. KTR9]
MPAKSQGHRRREPSETTIHFVEGPPQVTGMSPRPALYGNRYEKG